MGVLRRAGGSWSSAAGVQWLLHRLDLGSAERFDASVELGRRPELRLVRGGLDDTDGNQERSWQR